MTANEELFKKILCVGGLVLTLGLVLYGPIPPLQDAIKPSIALTTAGHILLGIGVAIVLNAVPSAIMTAARKVGYSDSLDTSSNGR